MIISLVIFILSAAVLALELVLVRALSICHWHHLSFLVISTALLGFGSGGIFVSAASKTLNKDENKSLWFLSLGFGLTIPLVFYLCQKIPLDQLQLIWDRRQILYLLAYYLLFFIPFFFAGSGIALLFTRFADKAGSLYFFNMTGSGFGAAAIVILMYGYQPSFLLLVISLFVFLSVFFISIKLHRRYMILTLICTTVCLFIFSSKGPFSLTLKISENKSLVYFRALPGAENLAVRYSPLGRLDCIKAPSIRHFPAMSIAYRGSVPEQILIITDADSISAINHFDDINDLGCYDYMTSALPYHLQKNPEVCVIGAGGGSDIVQALALGAYKVTAVEMNHQVIDLMNHKFNEFSSGLYKRDDVCVVKAEGRNFLQTTDCKFDIINISLLDSFSASAAGLYALNESHLYTIEAVQQAIGKLKPDGILSITRMLKSPPRDSLKMFATIAETLGQKGITNPGEYMVMIRSWATATILASIKPFSKSQLETVSNFAKNRSFDLVHLKGIEPNQVNKFHQLEEPVYYEGARQLLSAGREEFYRNYLYNIRPATDDRPYFFDFFKWKSLPYMAHRLPGQWLVFSEFGYLLLVITLAQAFLAAAIFILLPLLTVKSIKTIKLGKSQTMVYFLLLGFAYMFLEMGFIQKMTLLIGHPVFGLAITLTGFLVFSGLGALFSSRLSISAFLIIFLSAFAIIFVGCIEIIMLKLFFGRLLSFSQPIRFAIGLTVIAPLAFFMGMPFPTALKHLNHKASPLVPWAWGINGFASVVGTVLGTLLAISAGFTALSLTALVCYFFAVVISKQMCA